MSERHLVLIHGAWQGAWAFDAWLPFLRSQGWHAHAVDLPGNGWGEQANAPASLDDYVRTVSRCIDSIDAPVVLVGHSGGGITATQVTESMPERIAATVYLAGMMLPSGVSFAEIVAQCLDETPCESLRGIGPYLEHSPDGAATRVPPEAAMRIFLQDCEPAAARQAAERLRWQPESGRAMSPTWTAERGGRVPRIYVECTQDRSVGLAVQRRMQALSPGARRLTLDCGHVPQLAQPAALTALLASALDQVSSSHDLPSRTFR